MLFVELKVKDKTTYTPTSTGSRGQREREEGDLSATVDRIRHGDSSFYARDN